MSDEWQRQEAGPSDAGQQLEDVTAARPDPGLVGHQVSHAAPLLAHPASVELGGDRSRILGVAVAPRGEHLAETVNRPGTVSMPVPVLTRTSLRHRRGFWKVSC